MKILIINGPNLNLLGAREPEIYGGVGMADCLLSLRRRYGIPDIEYFQSNHEGAIIDELQRAYSDGSYTGIVLNAGAFTHTSLAIADAIRSIKPLPVIEVHISNVWTREECRHHSYISPACAGVIAGLGMDVYRLGVEALAGLSTS